jgi:hypothetical protein
MSTETLQQLFNYSLTSVAPLLMLTSTAILIGCLFIAIIIPHFALLRYLIFATGAALAFYVSTQTLDVSQAYFINLSTELLGALIAALLLSPLILEDNWLFPVTLFLISATILPVDMIPSNFRDYLINLSTELVGAFIIIALIQQQRLMQLTESKTQQRERIRTEKQALLEEMRSTDADVFAHRRKALQDMQKQMQAKKREFSRNIKAEFDGWIEEIEDADIAIIIVGDSQIEARRKMSGVVGNLQNVHILREKTDLKTGIAECCLIAQITPQQHG